VLPRHQIKTEDSIGIRIRVVIEKFCPNTTVVYTSDTHSFPNGCLLPVIESEGNQEHIVDADVMFTYRAEPETRA